MSETTSPGEVAMAVSWAAFALTAYLVVAGAPVRGVQLAALLVASAAVAAAGYWIAAERGYRVGDGVAAALLVGALIGIVRRPRSGGPDGSGQDDSRKGGSP
jgi:hypothetical protein